MPPIVPAPICHHRGDLPTRDPEAPILCWLAMRGLYTVYPSSFGAELRCPRESRIPHAEHLETAAPRKPFPTIGGWSHDLGVSRVSRGFDLRLGPEGWRWEACRPTPVLDDLLLVPPGPDHPAPPHGGGGPSARELMQLDSMKEIVGWALVMALLFSMRAALAPFREMKD